MISFEVVDDLLQKSRPRSYSLARTMALLLAGAVLGALVARPSWLGQNLLLHLVVPQILLGAAVAWVWTRARRQQRVMASLEDAWEAVQFRNWDRAESLLLYVLRRPLPSSPIRVRSFLALAGVADGRRQYDILQHVLLRLLQEYEVDRGLNCFIRIALAGVMLHTDQLTDAIHLIEKLNRETLPQPLRARVELLNLFRSVRMGQVDDALQAADQRRDLFRRYLGTKAGYGYGLLAAAFDRAGNTEQAACFWRDATLLMPPDEMVERFTEMRAVAAKYPPTSWPI